MSRELHITVVVSLPDDHFAAADILTEIKAPIAALREALGDKAKIETEIVTPRKPRAASGSANGARRGRKPAQSSGQENPNASAS